MKRIFELNAKDQINNKKEVFKHIYEDSEQLAADSSLCHGQEAQIRKKMVRARNQQN